ncbi:hypothetical protein HID58_070350, partial [Brassica napus]
MISLTTSFWSEKLRKFAAFLALSSIIHHRRCKTSPFGSSSTLAQNQDRVLHVNQLCILQRHLVRDQRNLR